MPWGEIASRPRGRRGYQSPQLPYVTESMIDFGYAGLEDSSTLRYSCVPRGWFNGIEVPFSFCFNTSFLFPSRIKREENSLFPLPPSLSQNMARQKS